MTLPYDALTAALDAWLGQHIPNLAVKEPWPSEAAGPAAVFRSIYEKPITGVAHGPEVYAHLRNARSPIDNRPPARMDRGHALDGAPGARGSPELPTLITVTAEDLESISPLVRKAGRALSSLPSPRKKFHVSLHRES